jgi:small basic protein
MLDRFFNIMVVSMVLSVVAAAALVVVERERGRPKTLSIVIGWFVAMFFGWAFLRWGMRR